MFAFIIASSLTLFISTKADVYPIYQAEGSYYSVGYQIGQQAAERIAKFIEINPDMDTMKQYIQTQTGKQEYEQLKSLNNQLYPNYIEELQGIAAGSNIDYNDILLINYEYELDALMAMHNYSTRLIQACSDLLVHTQNGNIYHGHNEDDWQGSLNTAYFTNITYKTSNNTNHITNHIFGFNYQPGLLTSSSSPGLSLTNSLTLTINYLFPFFVTAQGRATVFVSRSVLDSKDLKSAINAINGVIDGQKTHNISVGASFNIAVYGANNGNKNEIVNVESYMDSSDVLNIENGNYSYHFNTYQRMLGIEQQDMIYPSSNSRENRTIYMIENDDNGMLIDMDQMIEILGDTNNTQYPIYRNGYETTLVTTLYDLEHGIAHFYEQCDPKDCEPALSIKL